MGGGALGCQADTKKIKTISDLGRQRSGGIGDMHVTNLVVEGVFRLVQLDHPRHFLLLGVFVDELKTKRSDGRRKLKIGPRVT